MPVAVFSASTLAPGTAEPLASVTLPVRDPYRTWADAGNAHSASATTAATDKVAKSSCVETRIIHLSTDLTLGGLYLFSVRRSVHNMVEGIMRSRDRKG